MAAEVARTAAAAFISLYGWIIVIRCCTACRTLCCESRRTPLHHHTTRLITDTRRRDHITRNSIRELHWLHIRECVKFKVACLFCKSLSEQAPVYLADDCCLVSDSTTMGALYGQLTSRLAWYHEHLWRQNFSSSWTSLTNSLPAKLTSPDITYELFR